MIVVTSPVLVHDIWEFVEPHWQGKPSELGKKAFPGAISSTLNPTQNILGSNPVPHGKTPATDPLRHWHGQNY